MHKTVEFMGLILEDDVLRTPDGDVQLSELKKAEFVRDVVKDGQGPSTTGVSPGAVAGGAVVGGALFGPAGALAGGLLGSTGRTEVSGPPHYTTQSVQLIFETHEDRMVIDIPRDKETEAYHFAQKVTHAMKRRRG